MSSAWFDFKEARLGAQLLATATTTAIIGVTFLFLQATYRLFFHPLANVPGPKLAAMTGFWRFYYEAKGVLPFEVRRRQTDYDLPPIVRIGPGHVVVHDPDQYDVIYRVGSKFLKDKDFYERATTGHSSGTTVTACDKKYHASRRKDTMVLLSRQKVELLHPLVTEKLSIFLGHVHQLCEARRPVNVFRGWRCLTLDIISDFAFGQCVDSLDDPNFESDISKTLDLFVSSLLVSIRLPKFMLKLAQMPGVRDVYPGGAGIYNFFQWAENCVRNFRPKEDKPCVFDTLMDPARPEKLTAAQLAAEAEDLLIAGSDTTATTLTYACIHLARQPELWERLYREIRLVYGPLDQAPPLKVLENIPLLTAVIKESLRISSPVQSYLWRTVPPEGYHYTHGGTTYHVPAGTSIGMSAWVQNNDPDIFPDPREFKPSRWLTSDAAAADLDGYMVTFSKGTRACGGINLAWLEMYLALAALVMRYRVKGEAEPGKEIVMLDQFVGWFPDPEWNIYFEPRSQEDGIST